MFLLSVDQRTPICPALQESLESSPNYFLFLFVATLVQAERKSTKDTCLKNNPSSSHALILKCI